MVLQATGARGLFGICVQGNRGAGQGMGAPGGFFAVRMKLLLRIEVTGFVFVVFSVALQSGLRGLSIKLIFS